MSFTIVVGTYTPKDRAVFFHVLMLAASASPVALFVIGTYLYGHNIKVNAYEMTILTIYKLDIVPIVAFGITIIAQPAAFTTNAIIFFTSMPTAVTALLIAKSYGFNASFISAAIFINMLVSLATISGILLLL